MSDDESHPDLKFNPFVIDPEGFHREVHANRVCVSLSENISCLESSYNAENGNFTHEWRTETCNLPKRFTSFFQQRNHL